MSSTKKNLTREEFKLTDKEIEKLCTAGAQAPSGGNIQPWQVVIYQKRILELRLDPERSNTFLDVGQLASFLALGAFYENVCIAADSLGLKYQSNKLPYKKLTDPVVRWEFFERITNPKKHLLYEPIYTRCSNRKIHEDEIIRDEIINDLKRHIHKINPNLSLHTVSEDTKKKLVTDILGKADGIRTLHNKLFVQMMHEIRWNRKEVEITRDGIDIDTMELPALVVKMLKLMSNHPRIRLTFPRLAFENQAKPLLMASSHLCCLTTNDKITTNSIFEAGRVMQQMWLRATFKNLAVHPWTVLPFFILRVQHFHGEGFNKQDQEQIKNLDKQLHQVYKLSINETPFFIFRLSKTDPPTLRALRLKWNHFTKLID